MGKKAVILLLATALLGGCYYKKLTPEGQPYSYDEAVKECRKEVNENQTMPLLIPIIGPLFFQPSQDDLPRMFKECMQEKGHEIKR